MSAVKIVFLLNILNCHARAIEDCSFLCGDSNSGRLEPQFEYKSSLSLVGNLLDGVITSNQIPTTPTMSLSPTTPRPPTTTTTTDSKLELTSPVTTLNPASRLLNTFQSLKNLEMMLSDCAWLEILIIAIVQFEDNRKIYCMYYIREPVIDCFYCN